MGNVLKYSSLGFEEVKTDLCKMTHTHSAGAVAKNFGIFRPKVEENKNSLSPPVPSCSFRYRLKQK